MVSLVISCINHKYILDFPHAKLYFFCARFISFVLILFNLSVNNVCIDKNGLILCKYPLKSHFTANLAYYDTNSSNIY